MLTVFINDSNELFFSTDEKQRALVSDDFVDLTFMTRSKKWILKELDATEIPNPDPQYQA